eukprot:scaffold17464_cov80-Skeletonema_dohrnii-CCMP3373.AAC.3
MRATFNSSCQLKTELMLEKVIAAAHRLFSSSADTTTSLGGDLKRSNLGWPPAPQDTGPPYVTHVVNYFAAPIIVDGIVEKLNEAVHRFVSRRIYTTISSGS